MPANVELRMSRPAPISAHWRNIVILSWPIDEDRLAPFLPYSLALDRWDGTPYVSLVCLCMESLRALGLPTLPRSIAEVNLRFYVRFPDQGEEHKGVVFLRQLVSNPFVGFAGRHLFREPMLHTPVSWEFEKTDPSNGQRRLHYRWGNGGRDEELRVTAGGDTYLAESGSFEEFLTARYLGFNAQSGSRVRAYRISREPWRLVQVIEHELKWDVGTVCAPRIADVLAGPPASVLLATGSDTRIHWPTKLR